MKSFTLAYQACRDHHLPSSPTSTIPSLTTLPCDQFPQPDLIINEVHKCLMLSYLQTFAYAVPPSRNSLVIALPDRFLSSFTSLIWEAFLNLLAGSGGFPHNYYITVHCNCLPCFFILRPTRAAFVSVLLTLVTSTERGTS